MPIREGNAAPSRRLDVDQRRRGRGRLMQVNPARGALNTIEAPVKDKAS